MSDALGAPGPLLPLLRGCCPGWEGGAPAPAVPPPRADPGSAALAPPGEAETSDGDREQTAAARGRQAAAAASQGEGPRDPRAASAPGAGRGPPGCGVPGP